MAPRIYYSPSTVAEIGLLGRNKGTYHGVMLRADLAALYSSTVALRLGAMRKPFFVDPCTAPLGLDTGLISRGGVMSSSYRRLVERMDAAAESDALGGRIGKDRLTPADFGVGGSGRGTADLTDALVAGSLDVQQRCLDPAASMRGRSIRKYSELLGGRVGAAPARAPEFAVAPYFCAPDAESEWFEVNVKLFKAAARRERGAYAVLCMDGEPDGWKGMAEKAADAYPGAGGFLVWAAGFDDARAPESHLMRYGEMLSAVRETKKPVVVLHAGYYALLLSARLGIAGYARGIGGSAAGLGGRAAGGYAPQGYYSVVKKSLQSDSWSDSKDVEFVSRIDAWNSLYTGNFLQKFFDDTIPAMDPRRGNARVGRSRPGGQPEDSVQMQGMPERNGEEGRPGRGQGRRDVQADDPGHGAGTAQGAFYARPQERNRVRGTGRARRRGRPRHGKADRGRPRPHIRRRRPDPPHGPLARGAALRRGGPGVGAGAPPRHALAGSFARTIL